MKKQRFKQFMSVLLVVCMVLAYAPVANATSITWKETDQKITVDRGDRLVNKDNTADRDPNEMVRVSIVLEKPSTVGAGYSTMGIASNPDAMAYRDKLLNIQKQMEKTISLQALGGKSLDVIWNMTLVGNIISARVPYSSLEKIASIQGVKAVAMEAQYEPATVERNEDVNPNAYSSGNMIGSSTLWNDGYTGAGTRIAIIDTGTDIEHQSFDNDAYLYALRENAEIKGMEYEKYITSLDLLDAEEIASVFSKLHVSARNNTIISAALYGNEKQAFGFNYVDGNLNINHMNDKQGEHGSHVAGISTANRYIPQENGNYVDARDSVLMLGVAPDAQLITMKVFGENNPYDSDYMAAIEDAIILNCDVVNLSMGTTMPGSPYTDVYSNLMEMLKETDTVVTISAGNASNWAAPSLFGYLYNDDVSFDTVGAPGSYESAFTVASVDNDGTVGNYFSVGEKSVFYAETTGFGNTAMVTLDTSTDQTGTEYDYVFLDGLGYVEEYDGIDVNGKIVLVSRGTLNYVSKANNALSRGAVAVVVYNNQSGMHSMDLSGLSYAAPVVSITQADGEAIRAVSEDKGTYHTGKLTIHGKMGMGMNDSEYYTMSSFSSWGVPSSLTLKPEITAPGGNIYSIWGSNNVTGGGSDQYETMSGTSMAAPQVAGMAALLAQYYEENGMADKSGISARHLAQSLLMSTATPLREEASGGNYYSLLNQGAGLAQVDLSANADSYIQVSGQDDGKVKAELGDDPDRTGIYTFDFTITNMTNSAKAYTLDADLFRQDVFEYQEGSEVWLLDTWTTGLDAEVAFYSDAISGGSGSDHDLNGDGVTNTEDADYLLEYVVGNVTNLKSDGDISGDGQINSYDAHLLLASLTGEVLTVPAKGKATVNVRMTLTGEAKAELNAETPKGTYVEAFVYAHGVADAEGNVGTTHSIPVLAFYGDWSEPSMFDRGTLMELQYMTCNIAPYLYQTIGYYGNALAIDYGDGKEYYYGGNPLIDDKHYLPERNAFNSTDASKLTEQGYTLIRGAGAARMQITNAVTGEVYFERMLGELFPTYYNVGLGSWENTIQYTKLNWTGSDAEGNPLAEGTKIKVSLTAVPHYYRQPDGNYSFDGLGSGSTMTTTLTIDNTAPKMLNMDDSKILEGKLTVTAQDNEYVAAVALLNGNGTKTLSCDTPNQTLKNDKVTVELDISQVYGQKFLVAVFDYANNMRTYEVTLDLPEIERDYFTAINTNTGAYVSIDMACNMKELSTLNASTQARAAEYVDGYVFTVTNDNMLYVAKDSDLTTTSLIGAIDKKNEWLLTSVTDMAYNYKDGQLYMLFYSEQNSEEVPYLATLNLSDGSMDVLGQMPVDVHTLAIDGEGNCYSAAYSAASLYTYTIESAMAGQVTHVGEMGSYATGNVCCMAWDHNQNQLYFMYSDTLLQINHETAEPTLLGYFDSQLVGLYIRSGEPSGRFDPIAEVDRIELNMTDARIMLDKTLTLETTIYPWNASDKTITWTSSNESIATVNDKGLITACGLGSCTITATSNLDSSVTAQCSINTFQLEKNLNGLVWDEDGKIWMSEFSVANLDNFTKLHDIELGNNLSTATMSQDGNIYAASLDVSTLKSSLYKLDPDTYQATLIGPSTDAYVDLAPAPGQPGNSLMAVYGGNVMQVDATTGDYYNWYYMFNYNLVAIAYVGTQEYKDYGFDTMVDWYFIIDRVGTVYLMGFLEQKGSYYYLEHDTLAPDGVYTKLDFEMETPYFGSAYFDGEMLYFSAYKESSENVTLMAIDVASGSKACYEIGTFADDMCPVVGLMDLDKTELDNNIDLLSTTVRPVAVEQKTELKGIREEKAEGSLNSAIAPMSSSDVKDDFVYIDVTLPYDGTNADMTISFDTSMLELVDVDGNTTAFAWNKNDGEVTLSLAKSGIISTTSTVARMTFKPVDNGQTTISIITNGLGAEGCGHNELVTVSIDSVNSGVNFSDVSESEFYYEPVLWAVKKGITAGMTATTFAPDASCTRGQVVTFLWRAHGCPEPKSTSHNFIDLKENEYYYKAVLWAVENGITSGMTKTTFAPDATVTRGQFVTFLHRAEGKPTYTVSNPFTDLKTGEYYYDAVLWAVENKVTSGLKPTLFGPEDPCTRGQVVTFLYRAYNE